MASTVDNSMEVARFCLDRGLVDLVRFKNAETKSKASGGSIFQALVAEQAVDPALAKTTIATYLDIPQVNASDVEGKVAHYLNAIPANFAPENRIVSFAEDDYGFKVAISEPSALRSISSVRLITGKDVSAHVVSPIEMDSLLNVVKSFAPKPSTGSAIKINPPQEKSKPDASRLQGLLNRGNTSATKAVVEPAEAAEASQGKPVISFVNDLISNAIKLGASDIHLDTYKEHADARYRIDGVLEKRKSITQFLFDNYAGY